MKLFKIISVFIIMLILSGCSLLSSQKTNLTENVDHVKLSPAPVSLPMDGDKSPYFIIESIFNKFRQISGINNDPSAKSFLYNYTG